MERTRTALRDLRKHLRCQLCFEEGRKVYGTDVVLAKDVCDTLRHTIVASLIVSSHCAFQDVATPEVLHVAAGGRGPVLALAAAEGEERRSQVLQISAQHFLAVPCARTCFKTDHAGCLDKGSALVVDLDESRELHLAPACAPEHGQKAPVFCGFITPCGAPTLTQGLLKDSRIALVLDLDETLVHARTLDRLDACIDTLRTARPNNEATKWEDGLLQHDKSLLCQFTQHQHVWLDGKRYDARYEAVRLDCGSVVRRPVVRLYDGSTILTRLDDTTNHGTPKIIRIRPGWERLRRFLAGGGDGKKRFEVYVCTKARREYALEAWRLLDPDGLIIPQEQRSTRIVNVTGNKSLHGTLGWPQPASDAEHIPPLAVIVDDLTNVWHTNDQGHVLKVLPYNPYRDHALRQAGVDVAHADASDNELARVQEAIMYIRGQFYKDFIEKVRPAAKELVTRGLPTGDSVGVPRLPTFQTIPRLVKAYMGTMSVRPPVPKRSPRCAAPGQAPWPPALPPTTAPVIAPAGDKTLALSVRAMSPGQVSQQVSPPPTPPTPISVPTIAETLISAPTIAFTIAAAEIKVPRPMVEQDACVTNIASEPCDASTPRSPTPDKTPPPAIPPAIPPATPPATSEAPNEDTAAEPVNCGDSDPDSPAVTPSVTRTLPSAGLAAVPAVTVGIKLRGPSSSVGAPSVTPEGRLLPAAPAVRPAVTVGDCMPGPASPATTASDMLSDGLLPAADPPDLPEPAAATHKPPPVPGAGLLEACMAALVAGVCKEYPALSQDRAQWLRAQLYSTVYAAVGAGSHSVAASAQSAPDTRDEPAGLAGTAGQPGSAQLGATAAQPVTAGSSSTHSEEQAGPAARYSGAGSARCETAETVMLTRMKRASESASSGSPKRAKIVCPPGSQLARLVTNAEATSGTPSDVTLGRENTDSEDTHSAECDNGYLDSELPSLLVSLYYPPWASDRYKTRITTLVTRLTHTLTTACGSMQAISQTIKTAVCLVVFDYMYTHQEDEIFMLTALPVDMVKGHAELVTLAQSVARVLTQPLPSTESQEVTPQEACDWLRAFLACSLPTAQEGATDGQGAGLDVYRVAQVVCDAWQLVHRLRGASLFESHTWCEVMVGCVKECQEVASVLVRVLPVLLY